MNIEFKLLEVNIHVSLHTGINGMHRIVLDSDTSARYQIPITTADLDVLISKLREMRREIRELERKD